MVLERGFDSAWPFPPLITISLRASIVTFHLFFNMRTSGMDRTNDPPSSVRATKRDLAAGAAEGAAPRRLEEGSAMAASTGDLAGRIASANAMALRRLGAIEPVLVGVREARHAIPALRERALLHAGPPIAPGALCGPMRGAILGAAVYEGWAADLRAAKALLDQGAIALHSAHDAGAVAPMAGIVSPTMPVLEVRDAHLETTAYAPLNEGIGAVLRFGANDASVVARLRWMRDALAPALDAAVRSLGGVPLVPLMARALAMGDEMHQRNIAATSLFCRAVAPALAERAPGPDLPAALRFLAGSDQFFLNVAMAAAKCALESIREIPHSTIVTAMSRNGVEFGIRVSGLGTRWFTAPAPVVAGMYFPGFTPADANPDMGGSAILETLGLGGEAIAASPSLPGLVR